MSSSTLRSLPADTRRRDVLRLALQCAVGGTAAFALTRMTGSGEAFLAVISAVLVLQVDWDETLGKAGWRMAGAVVGTIVGIAVLAVAGGGALAPLAAGLLVMGAIAAWEPRLSFGLVAAAGLSVGSDAGFLETAQQRTLAIFMGSAAGILAGLLVWPQTGPSRAARHLRQAIEKCRDLLEDSLDAALAGRKADDLAARHRGLNATLAQARKTAEAIKFDRFGLRGAYTEAVHAAERLWHALIILNRVVETKSEEQLPVKDSTRDRIEDIRAAACSALACAARIEPMSEDDLAAIRSTNERIWRESRVNPHDADELQSIALIFGIGEVLRNLCELDAAIGAVRKAR